MSLEHAISIQALMSSIKLRNAYQRTLGRSNPMLHPARGPLQGAGGACGDSSGMPERHSTDAQRTYVAVLNAAMTIQVLSACRSTEISHYHHCDNGDYRAYQGESTLYTLYAPHHKRSTDPVPQPSNQPNRHHSLPLDHPASAYPTTVQHYHLDLRQRHTTPPTILHTGCSSYTAQQISGTGMYSRL